MSRYICAVIVAAFAVVVLSDAGYALVKDRENPCPTLTKRPGGSQDSPKYGISDTAPKYEDPTKNNMTYWELPSSSGYSEDDVDGIIGGIRLKGRANNQLAKICVAEVKGLLGKTDKYLFVYVPDKLNGSGGGELSEGDKCNIYMADINLGVGASGAGYKTSNAATKAARINKYLARNTTESKINEVLADSALRAKCGY